MPYKARFSRVFIKKEGKLASDVRSRVVEALREVLVNPHVGVPLVGPLRGLWRVRVGKYRLLYEVDEKQKMVVFHDVDLRKRVY
jgi:mRNA interferase RelE/StbE